MYIKYIVLVSCVAPNVGVSLWCCTVYRAPGTSVGHQQHDAQGSQGQARITIRHFVSER